MLRLSSHHFEQITSLVDALPEVSQYNLYSRPPKIYDGRKFHYGLNPIDALTQYFTDHMSQTWEEVRKAEPSEYMTPGAFSAENSVRACIKDTTRTKRFVEGIVAAVRQKEKDIPAGKPIKVCDAGTGAFALLAVVAALSSPRVHATALDITPTSVACAKGIVENLGLKHQVDVVQADATSVQLPDTPDIVVSETMHTCLFEELIVQIMSNVVPQARPDASILPGQIDLHAALGKWGESQKLQSALSWPVVLSYIPGQPLETVRFRAHRLPGAFSLLPDFHMYTRVNVQGRWIEPGSSAISYIRSYPLGTLAPFGKKIQYKPGDILKWL